MKKHDFKWPIPPGFKVVCNSEKVTDLRQVDRAYGSQLCGHIDGIRGYWDMLGKSFRETKYDLYLMPIETEPEGEKENWHHCKYCGVWTDCESDEECYAKSPNEINDEIPYFDRQEPPFNLSHFLTYIKDNHSIEIPDRILQDYEKYGKHNENV